MLISLTLLVTFVVLEVGFRGARAVQRHLAISSAKTADDLWAVYDPVLGYRLNPKFGDVNADGLRDHPIPEKGDHFRLLMLGDSVGYYGDDVDDTYVGRLRTRLNVDREKPLQVVNASVKGYTTYQELLYLEHHGLALEPDLVGVGFVLNDLHRFLHSFHVRDGKILDYKTYSFTEEATGKQPGLMHSQFLDWLSYKLDIAGGVVSSELGDGYQFEQRIDISNAWKDESWEAIREYFERFKALGETHGFRVFATVFPLGLQYEEAELARNREYVLKPQRKLREICAALEIPLLDLYPLLAPDDLGEDRLHLSPAGRGKAAAEIAKFLEEQELIPAGR